MSKPIYLRIKPGFFSSSQLNDCILGSDINDPDRLYLYARDYNSRNEIPFSEKDIDELLLLLDNPQIQIARLDLVVDPEIIKTETFKKLIKKLDPEILHYLLLGFANNLSQEQVNTALTESGIADLASYPISIDCSEDIRLDQRFIETNINNVRRYEQQPRKKHTPKKMEVDDPSLPQIKLKDIISSQKLRENDTLLSIDVTIEAEVQMETQVEAEVEVSVEVQSECYTSQKYDYDEFMQRKRHNGVHPDKRNIKYCDVSWIQQELFARLPGAIQYVTRTSSDKLHDDFSQMMSFNKDNLPPGMFLHKTPEATLVLDYDMAYERNYNAFTPVGTQIYEEDEDSYFHWQDLPDDFNKYEEWLVLRDPDSLPYAWMDERLTQTVRAHFVNVYIRYGMQKIKDFIKLFEVDKPLEQKALSQCLRKVFQSYVFSFRQCDLLIKAPWFEDCLQRIRQEKDIAKLACFSSLLWSSAYAKHDLQHTLNSFDIFWEKIKQICPEEQLEKVKFSVLSYGGAFYMAPIPPVVAMERLLTILQNARDVSSQIDYLDEVPSGAFRSYYASTQEGFSMIHKDMDISWAPNVYNMQYLTEWPSNLAYFKNTFVVFRDELFYITSALQREPVPYTTVPWQIETYKQHLAELKKKKFIQILKEDLGYFTAYKPEPIPYNQHAKIYQVDLSTLHDMALKEDVIHYPKFYAFLHRYMGQQRTGISYADFRAQTANCDFQHKDKTIAFALLFFMTDVNYDESLGITPLITQLKQLKPAVLNQLAETLYKLKGRGIVLNNQEGLKILNELLTRNPQAVLNQLNDRKLIITEYDELFNKFRSIVPAVKKAIKKSHIEITQAFVILNTLQDFPKEQQQGLFNSLKPELHNDIEPLCNTITRLRVAALPPQYISHYICLKEIPCDLILERFTKDQDDPILSYILSSHFTGNSADGKKLLTLTAVSQNKHMIVALLKNHDVLQYIEDAVALDILAKSKNTLSAARKLSVEQWQELSRLLSSLKNRDALIHLYKIAAPDSACLLDALKNNRLSTLEREPFGPRDDARHFDLSQTERVVNDSMDWSNNTVYRYKYRKQLMEAVTFVNAIGYQLPIFEGKTVKELSNADIQSCFSDLKNKRIFQDLSPFQRQLIALSLIREALYRSTGQMAYSTQLIAVIDCLMRKGHVISNIDTGQGKSLIDMMKAALLWLDSDRVDITTSSIMDAKRDLENFTPFLSFLNIPHSQKPLTTQSEFPDFVADGVNIGTFAQMSLFEKKMQMQSHVLGEEMDRVSLIINPKKRSCGAPSPFKIDRCSSDFLI